MGGGRGEAGTGGGGGGQGGRGGAKHVFSQDVHVYKAEFDQTGLPVRRFGLAVRC